MADRAVPLSLGAAIFVLDVGQPENLEPADAMILQILRA